MWAGQLNNQSGVLDVTIQCQLNMATRNLQEMTTSIIPASVGSNFRGFASPVTEEVRSNTNCVNSSGNINAQRKTLNYENISPTKSFPSCEFATDGDFTNVFMTPPTRTPFQQTSSVKQGQNVNCTPNYNHSSWNYYPTQQQNTAQFLNDSGYGSPGLTGSTAGFLGSNTKPECVPENVILNSVECEQQFTASCAFRNSFGTTFSIPGNNVVQSSPSPDSGSFDDDMKIAMKEKDVTHRIFSLKSKGYESAQEVEEFYQQQTRLIDIERHNILRQMSYDKMSSASINGYYNRKLLSILESVDEKLSELEKRKIKSKQSQKKSRLLPKAAVKILESWYQDNLSNPYPSREVTLSMAAEGGITVEQIRKWFANKRNRSRNSKLKASDADSNE